MLDEVVQKSLVVLIKLNLHLPCVGGGTIGEVEEVDIEGLLRERLLALMEDLLGPLAIKGAR